jgi:hypothetical protein
MFSFLQYLKLFSLHLSFRLISLLSFFHLTVLCEEFAIDNAIPIFRLEIILKNPFCGLGIATSSSNVEANNLKIVLPIWVIRIANTMKLRYRNSMVKMKMLQICIFAFSEKYLYKDIFEVKLLQWQ